jgi:hypothetical protein
MQQIVTSPQFGIAEDGMGGDNLSEPLLGIRIVWMEVGMVRLNGLAEGFLKSLGVVIGIRTKQLIKGFHQRVLDLTRNRLQKLRQTPTRVRRTLAN